MTLVDDEDDEPILRSSARRWSNLRPPRLHVYYSDHPDIDIIRELANHPDSNTRIIELNAYTDAYRNLKTLTCIEIKGNAYHEIALEHTSHKELR